MVQPNDGRARDALEWAMERVLKNADSVKSVESVALRNQGKNNISVWVVRNHNTIHRFTWRGKQDATREMDIRNIDDTDTDSTTSSCASCSIRDYDINTLNPHQWLNDNIISLWMGKLRKHYPTFGYEAYLYNVLHVTEHKNRRGTPTSNVDSDHAIAFLRHQNNNHWSLVVAFPKDKKIVYYNSLNMTRDAQKHPTRIQTLYPSIQWQNVDNTDNCPQQTNGNDCGVYVCMFAESVAKKEAITPDTKYKPTEYRQTMQKYFRSCCAAPNE